MCTKVHLKGDGGGTNRGTNRGTREEGTSRSLKMKVKPHESNRTRYHSFFVSYSPGPGHWTYVKGRELDTVNGINSASINNLNINPIRLHLTIDNSYEVHIPFGIF